LQVCSLNTDDFQFVLNETTAGIQPTAAYVVGILEALDVNEPLTMAALNTLQLDIRNIIFVSSMRCSMDDTLLHISKIKEVIQVFI